MSANSLNNTTYNNAAANTVNGAVISADLLLAWRQNVFSVVNQHAEEINKNTASLVTNGWQKLASGLIIQWGVTPAVTPSTLTDLVYPLTFPNACFSVVCVLESFPDVAAVVVSSISRDLCGVTHNAPSAKQIRFIVAGW